LRHIIKRRDLITLFGAASALPAAALAPFGAAAQPGPPVIGYLSSRSAEAEAPDRTPSWKDWSNGASLPAKMSRSSTDTPREA
jgi:hypothetical protein